MNEEWTKWDIPGEVVPNYYIYETNYDNSFLELKLFERDNDKKGLRITFKNSVLSYNNADEGCRYKTLVGLGDKYGNDFYHQWGFFKIKNSSYISFLEKRSHGVVSNKLIHFCILSMEETVDIIAEYEPEVEHIIIK